MTIRQCMLNSEYSRVKHDKKSQQGNLWQGKMCVLFFSFNLLINVVSHDAIVWVILVRMVAFIKDEQREKTQRSDIIVKYGILHDLRRHYEHVILRHQVAQWQLGILVAT